MPKSVYKAIRLDGIAPKSDRIYIAAGHVSALMCLIASAVVIAFTFAAPELHVAASVSALTAGYAFESVALISAIKETVRNRFFSAVRLCVLSAITLAAVIAATCVFIIY